jgi:hypothetical protein
VDKIKASFANMGAYSNEDNFIRGDPEGVIEWISGETEAFEEILSDRGDVCACKRNFSHLGEGVLRSCQNPGPGQNCLLRG